MTVLSDSRKFYSVDDANISAADVPTGKIAYGSSGRLVGTGFTPAAISGCRLWLDAAQPGSSGRWDDLSGNGNHFVTGVNAALPTFSGGVASFDGTSQKLYGPSFASFTEGEIFYMMKRYQDDTATTYAGWQHFGTSTDSFMDHYTYAGTIYCGFGRGTRVTVGNPTQPTDAWTVINILSKASLWQFYMNEERMYNTTSNTPAFRSTPAIGGDYGGALWFRGDMKGVILYNRVLTSLERAQVRGYLAGL